jgi:hypothetical protein
MIERIKALAVEADFMLCEDGHFYSEGQSQKITDGLQKFAELIIQECSKCVGHDTANYPGEGMMSYYQGVQDAVKSIRKHFGVEE